MAAILKILKLSCTSPHSELFLCQVSLRCVKQCKRNVSDKIGTKEEEKE